MRKPVSLRIIGALTLPLAAAVAHAAPPTGSASAAVEALPRDDSALPKPLWPPGERLDSLRWRDRRGLNVAAFTRSPPRSSETANAKPHWVYLHAKHYLQRQGRWRLVRWVKDREQPCGLDLTADVLTPSPVTDLDGDGLGELTFAFRLACRGDVSPAELKLFILEDGAKYALRGASRVRVAPDEQVGGDHRRDPAFEHAAAAFRAHAERIWAKIVQEKF
ncbi:MAG: hypothetical protein IPL40_13690 [Proteobacteria bacterium]|nr:hypothetical protein [Pseudomonadota bacterium]